MHQSPLSAPGDCASCEAAPETCEGTDGGCCDDCRTTVADTHDRSKYDPHDHIQGCVHCPVPAGRCCPHCASAFAAPLTGPYTSKED